MEREQRIIHDLTNSLQAVLSWLEIEDCPRAKEALSKALVDLALLRTYLRRSA
jgi:hypothetical protein